MSCIISLINAVITDSSSEEASLSIRHAVVRKGLTIKHWICYRFLVLVHPKVPSMISGNKEGAEDYAVGFAKFIDSTSAISEI
jgi:hypothetical protein